MTVDTKQALYTRDRDKELPQAQLTGPRLIPVDAIPWLVRRFNDTLHVDPTIKESPDFDVVPRGQDLDHGRANSTHL